MSSDLSALFQESVGDSDDIWSTFAAAAPLPPVPAPAPVVQPAVSSAYSTGSPSVGRSSISESAVGGVPQSAFGVTKEAPPSTRISGPFDTMIAPSPSSIARSSSAKSSTFSQPAAPSVTVGPFDTSEAEPAYPSSSQKGPFDTSESSRPTTGLVEAFGPMSADTRVAAPVNPVAPPSPFVHKPASPITATGSAGPFRSTPTSVPRDTRKASSPTSSIENVNTTPTLPFVARPTPGPFDSVVPSNSEVDAIFGIHPAPPATVAQTHVAPPTVMPVGPTTMQAPHAREHSPLAAVAVPQQTTQAPRVSNCPPIPAPTNLIAARRLAAAEKAVAIVQPEQDVIYKQYSAVPPASSLPPPPVGTNGPPRFTSVKISSPIPFPISHGAAAPQPGPTAASHIVHHTAPTAASPMIPQPAPMNLRVSPMVPQPGQMNTSLAHMAPPAGPVASVSPPVMSGPFDTPSFTHVGPAMAFPTPSILPPVSSSLIPNVPSARPRSEGMKALCSFGFGGKLVVFGGRFGMKVAMHNLPDLLSSSSAVLSSFPGPLTSVNPSATEAVVSFCEQSILRQQKSDNKREAWMWKYLILLLRTSGGPKKAKSEFIKLLWTEAVSELGARVDVGSTLFKFTENIVNGDMNAAISLTGEGPDILYPIAMAIASIHSAEYFRQSVLAFARARPDGATGRLQREDEVLLSVLRDCITVFASTSVAAYTAEQEKKFVVNWKLYLCVVGSLVRTDDGGGSNFLLTLSEILNRTGNVSAGHLCVLLSGRTTTSGLSPVDSPDALLCLLGANHRDTAHFARFLDPSRVHMSEIFEYASRTETVPFFPALQPWKYAYAALLAGDYGMIDLAEKYLQVINAFVRAVPTNKYTVFFRSALRDLEMRIAGAKTVGDIGSVSGYGGSSVGGVGGISDVSQAAFGAIWGGIKAVAQTSRMI